MYVKNLAHAKHSIHRRIKFAILLSVTSLRMDFSNVWVSLKPYPRLFMTGNPFSGVLN